LKHFVIKSDKLLVILKVGTVQLFARQIIALFEPESSEVIKDGIHKGIPGGKGGERLCVPPGHDQCGGAG